ncbi:MAG: thiamine pyrophosphate-dependent enzyme [Methanomicrobiales archaeon]|nr:thiamine pyrophosphate-dependent enzyme [Methanomicrobiales archaeon]
MREEGLISRAQNTWCPGCGNFAIQHAFKNAILELGSEGLSLDEVVLVTGIGCHAKMADYFNLNSVYAIHGRAVPAAAGLKIADPNLKVICCVGDGDAYAEGLDHLLFAAKRNMDMTIIVHNNRVYGLTTGQYTPTSPLGFRGKSTPTGTAEPPFNPIALMLNAGASFVARGYTRRQDQLRWMIKEAIMHRGLSFIDVLQICATFFDPHEVYDRMVYEPEGHDRSSIESAMRLASEWDYNSESRIPIGLFFQGERPVFEDRFRGVRPDIPSRENKIGMFLEGRR